MYNLHFRYLMHLFLQRYKRAVITVYFPVYWLYVPVLWLNNQPDSLKNSKNNGNLCLILNAIRFSSAPIFNEVYLYTKNKFLNVDILQCRSFQIGFNSRPADNVFLEKICIRANHGLCTQTA